MVDVLVSHSLFIQHIGDAARHAGCKVIANRAKNDYSAASHILAAMVADSLHNSGCARIAHTESFARHAGNVCFAAGCAIERYVADERIRLVPDRIFRRSNSQNAAGKSLAQIIVAFAVKDDLLSPRKKSAERLTCTAGSMNTSAACKGCPKGTVRCQNFRIVTSQLFVWTLFKCKMEGRICAATDVYATANQAGKLQFCSGLNLQQIRTANQFIDRTGAELRHDDAQLSGRKTHEALNIFRLACKALAKFRILRSNAKGTGAQMTHTHHSAAHGD